MRRMENVVHAADLEWTFPRPAYIVDEPATGQYPIGDAANPRGGSKLPRADLPSLWAPSTTRGWSTGRPPWRSEYRRGSRLHDRAGCVRATVGELDPLL
jgi:hypothetical protein